MASDGWRPIVCWGAALKGRFDAWTIRPTRAAVQNLIGNDYAGGWSNAKRRGWKAVKVTVKPQPLPAPPAEEKA